ncbi:hypothetical protein BC629DRAFT_157583 [Irpex lacteus]|nr:hypothetical protein BC629DRAFT_157583 [Irpex lacteus]
MCKPSVASTPGPLHASTTSGSARWLHATLAMTWPVSIVTSSSSSSPTTLHTLLLLHRHLSSTLCFRCGTVGHLPNSCTAAVTSAGKPVEALMGGRHSNSLRSTSVSAAPPNMVPLPAPPRPDPRRVVTPLSADGLEEALESLGIRNDWQHVITGLREGFDIGLRAPVRSTVIHKNHKSCNLVSNVISL